jgi:hypothetical protein
MMLFEGGVEHENQKAGILTTWEKETRVLRPPAPRRREGEAGRVWIRNLNVHTRVAAGATQERSICIAIN